jgi:hypothetical protein
VPEPTQVVKTILVMGTVRWTVSFGRCNPVPE